MSKKFDVVIGNPPYQEEAQGGGTRDTPVYHLFMDAAYEVGKKAVLITPARFLFNAGFTPKAWNEKMLADPHLTVAALRARQRRAVPGHGPSRAASPSPTATRTHDGEPIGTFTKYPELNTILHKVVESGIDLTERLGITSSRSYRYTDKLYEDHPEARALRPEGNAALVNTNAFEQFSFLYSRDEPADGHEYVRVLGLTERGARPAGFAATTSPARRASTSTRSSLPDARTARGRQRLALGRVGEPDSWSSRQVAVTQTFITIGSFDDRGRGRGVPEVREVQVRAGDARRPEGHPAQPGEAPGSTFRCRTSRASSDIDWSKPIPRDRPAAVRQVRARRRGDRLHRGQGQADGMTAGEPC